MARRTRLSAVIAILSAAVALSGCTSNDMARNYGGSTTVKLPVGQKLVTATWKENDIWYLYRPMRAGETPEDLTFKESSSFGAVSGTVVFQESK